jgi:hypothetical protein
VKRWQHRAVATSALLALLLPLAGCHARQRHDAAGSAAPATPPSEKIVLFDGKDCSHWTHVDGKPVQWRLVDGTMEVVPGTGSIITKQVFQDFKLHVEFNVPQSPPEAKGQGRGNSGVYLQRRYEVQILDSYGLDAKSNDCGALYGLKAPDKNVSRPPGEWQTYDMTFRAARFEGEGRRAKKVQNARITVWHNGVLIHDDVELENKTGAGQPEGPQPGPILLQDHGNKVRFRDIRIELKS